MKFIRNAFYVGLLCLLLLVLLRAVRPLKDPDRIWVGGVELTEAGEIPTVSGRAYYDADANILLLTDAVIEGDFRGAAIYAEGDLTLRLVGDNALRGKKHGCVVLGDLTVSGPGSLSLEGERSGAAIRGCATVFDNASLRLTGKKPLRWGKLHVSPLVTVLLEEENLRVCPPDAVLLTDADVDAAGHPLIGEAYFETFFVKIGEPVPVPADPSRPGYWFGGWYADPALQTPWDFSGTHDGPVTIYARWIRIVTLSFDSWGGSEVPDELYAWGDVPMKIPATERPGYRFIGWYGDDRLREPYDWSLPLEGDREVYAKWEKMADITLSGIDAARYQGDVDWSAVKAAGSSFVFLRAGYRGYGSEGKLNSDDNFETNYDGARAAGMDVGVYFFSQATSEEEAREEARYVLSQLNGRSLDLPVVMDFELATDPNGKFLGRLYDAGLSGKDYVSIILAFCGEVEKNGYTAAVYAGQSILRDQVGDALSAAGYPVWLAHWTVQTRYNGDYEYWQYSGSGHVEGIEPEVDLDLRYVTAPPQVSGITAHRGDGANVVTWDRVPGVQGYVVYRSVRDGGFAEAARLSGAGSVSYSDKGADERCRYMVCAVIRVEGSDLRGVLSEIVSVS